MTENQDSEAEAPSSKGTNAELIRKYSEDLKFLWEQYNRFTGVGLILAGTTLGFILNMIIFNADLRQILDTSGVVVDSRRLIAAIFCACCSAFAFLACRWCSQILMERQVYASYTDAERYFRDILENETVWPTALRPKAYMQWIDRKSLLRFVGNINELAKWLGIMLIFASWIFSFAFAWPLIGTISS